jgi:WD40 repeat protein
MPWQSHPIVRHVVSGSDDDTLRVWDLESETEIAKRSENLITICVTLPPKKSERVNSF